MADHVLSNVIRKTSHTTGLSYLTNTAAQGPIKQLFIMVHGWGCVSSHYSPIINALIDMGHGSESGVLYIAPDLPGHGDSPGSIYPDANVAGITGLVIKLCVEVMGNTQEQTNPATASHRDIDVVLVGHSMGTRFALELFSQSPSFPFSHHVSSIILLDGSWGGSTPPGSNEIDDPEESKRVVLGHLDDFFGPRSSEKFKRETREMFEKADYVYLGKIGWSYGTWDALRAIDVLKSIPLMNQTVSADGGSVDVTDVLVVQSMEGGGPTGRRSLKKGEETKWMKMVRQNVGEKFYTGYVVADTGHYPHIDDVEDVAGVVDRFLRR